MFSRSAEYAVRALSFLATREGGISLQSKEIADELGLPPQFLTKILRRLTGTDLVASQRGRSGGFRLTRPPNQISMLEIIMPFEPQMTGLECVLGQSNCTDRQACPLHEPWSSIRKSLYDLLESTTLADVAERAIRDKSTGTEILHLDGDV